MSAILALPPPSTASSPTTFGRARALATSEALPVTPVRSIPDEDRRRQLREAARDDSDGIDGESASSSVVREALSDRRRDAGATGGEGGPGTGGAAYSEPVTAPLAGQSTGDSAGFVAQSIYQQNLGTGLHIEAWDSALTAYRRAEGTGVLAGGRGITV